MEVLFEEVLNYLDELKAHDASAPRLSNAATCRFGIPRLERVLVEERPKMQMIEFLVVLGISPQVWRHIIILDAIFDLFGFIYVLPSGNLLHSY